MARHAAETSKKHSLGHVCLSGCGRPRLGIHFLRTQAPVEWPGSVCTQSRKKRWCVLCSSVLCWGGGCIPQEGTERRAIEMRLLMMHGRRSLLPLIVGPPRSSGAGRILAHAEGGEEGERTHVLHASVDFTLCGLWAFAWSRIGRGVF